MMSKLSEDLFNRMSSKSHKHLDVVGKVQGFKSGEEYLDGLKKGFLFGEDYHLSKSMNIHNYDDWQKHKSKHKKYKKPVDEYISKTLDKKFPKFDSTEEKEKLKQHMKDHFTNVEKESLNSNSNKILKRRFSKGKVATIAGGTLAVAGIAKLAYNKYKKSKEEKEKD